MTPDALDVGEEPPRPPGNAPRSGAPGPKAGPALRTSTGSVAPRPLLASEALKDDLAPKSPLRRASRIGAFLGAAVGAAMAVAPAWKPLGKPWLEGASALAFAAIGTAPLRYTHRAVALVVLGLAIALLGVGGAGPASVLAYAVGEWGVLYVVAGVALPAALLFRSRYRAYDGARPILAAGLMLSCPFAVLTAFGFDTPSLAVQVTSGVALAALSFGLLGFMGSQTPLAGGALAAGIVAAITSPIPAHADARLNLASGAEWLSASGSTAAFAIACGMAGLGVFQLLARRHWTRARAVDVHPTGLEIPTPAPSAPSLTDTWNDRR